jgi:hypothetical protein
VIGHGEQMAELPTTWGQDKVSGGNHVLLGFAEFSLHLVAPPGVRFKLDEPDEERTNWRHAVWRIEDNDELPVISIDTPDLVVGMRTSEVVDMLPLEQHDFVRAEMARQLCRAISFGRPSSGACPNDEDALVAGRTLSWVNRELADAFPSEAWFRQDRPTMHIPNTVDEFLDRVSNDQLSAEDKPPRGARPVKQPRSLTLYFVPAARTPSYAFVIVWVLIGSLTSHWRNLTLRSLAVPGRLPARHR